MEPVEINAGAWYLRALRADDRVDDRPALAELGEAGPDYVARRAVEWRTGVSLTWAVCDPSSGELVAEAVLEPEPRRLSTRARTGYADAATAAKQTIRRYAAAALNIDIHH